MKGLFGPERFISSINDYHFATFFPFQSRDSLRDSGPRISQATLKALERKRKAK